jgi:Spy/CpxP family protein refolding chaperone
VLVAQDKEKKADPGKSEEAKAAKAKGYLPAYWKDLGLSDEQKQQVYTIQNKYGEEVDKLEAQIKDVKAKMAKERLKVLTASQKKKLEDVVKEKVGSSEK